jgi:hypothetical protein
VLAALMHRQQRWRLATAEVVLVLALPACLPGAWWLLLLARVQLVTC